MYKQRRKSGVILLMVFSAILLSPVFQSQSPESNIENEVTGIHTPEYSGEATENISRGTSDCSPFANRLTQDFTCLSLEAVHSNLSHSTYIQYNSYSVQSKPPIKVYKRIQQFLI